MSISTVATRRPFLSKNALPQKIVIAALIAGVLYYPSAVPNFRADRFSQAVIYAIIGLSVNILIGYAGQISLGHQAFVGIGAFSAAYLATNSGVPFGFTLIAAAGTGAATAALLGLVALRISGLYLALITLAYGAVAERSIFGIQKFTGGGLGMPAERPKFLAGDAVYAYLCLAILAALLFVDWRMLRTKFGRALLTIKSSEQVASSFGMNLIFYKVAAFVLAGGIAGLGGGLLAFKNQRVVSQDFTFQIALTFVIMVVVGGLGSRIGTVIGSAFIAYLPFILDRISELLHYDELIVLKIAISGLLLLLTITRFPGGIAQQLHPVTEWLSGKPFPRHHKKGKHSGDAPAAQEAA